MKYRFSEIIKFGNYWSWEKPYTGKYGCQVFDYDTDTYITFIICNTKEEVEQKIEELKRKQINMNLELFNTIMKDGEEVDIYSIKNKTYHKILYGGKVYTIIETKNGIELEVKNNDSKRT